MPENVARKLVSKPNTIYKIMTFKCLFICSLDVKISLFDREFKSDDEKEKYFFLNLKAKMDHYYSVVDSLEILLQLCIEKTSNDQSEPTNIQENIDLIIELIEKYSGNLKVKVKTTKLILHSFTKNKLSKENLNQLKPYVDSTRNDSLEVLKSYMQERIDNVDYKAVHFHILLIANEFLIDLLFTLPDEKSVLGNYFDSCKCFYPFKF